jgi:hypothetical protein
LVKSTIAIYGIFIFIFIIISFIFNIYTLTRIAPWMFDENWIQENPSEYHGGWGDDDSEDSNEDEDSDPGLASGDSDESSSEDSTDEGPSDPETPSDSEDPEPSNV